jgi:hypothetical protein
MKEMMIIIIIWMCRKPPPVLHYHCIFFEHGVIFAFAIDCVINTGTESDMFVMWSVQKTECFEVMTALVQPS